MISILFKNFDGSELARRTVNERLSDFFTRFPALGGSKLAVTLNMENSPLHPGPDAFSVRVRIKGGCYDGIIIEKSAVSLFQALAEVREHLLERLNRFGDKQTVKKRRTARKIKDDNKISEVNNQMVDELPLDI